mmetsp:Transcript_34648/g.73016  ORF Transcript_34648/g.73016 Transcript_34648/m.73016 type:complete len:81 (-) Transcript_34648:226-468(-)
MRPLVYCSSTFINCPIQWIDHWLQKCKALASTYLKDSVQLLDKLQDLDVLLPYENFTQPIRIQCAITLTPTMQLKASSDG